jgi:hypothetical protein
METIIIGCIIAWVSWNFIKFIFYVPSNIKTQYGQSGENVVADILGKLGDDYEVKYDVRIGHTQIDHLAIRGKTIFVVETKRWNGKISGKRNYSKWKQELGSQEYWLGNPILQNEHHIEKLREEYKGYEFVNVVVFVGSQSIPRLNGVMRDNKLREFIVGYEKAS